MQRRANVLAGRYRSLTTRQMHEKWARKGKAGKAVIARCRCHRVGLLGKRTPAEGRCVKGGDVKSDDSDDWVRGHDVSSDAERR